MNLPSASASENQSQEFGQTSDVLYNKSGSSRENLTLIATINAAGDVAAVRMVYKNKNNIAKKRLKKDIEELYKTWRQFVTLWCRTLVIVYKTRHNDTRQAGQRCPFENEGKQGRCLVLNFTLTGLCPALA